RMEAVAQVLDHYRPTSTITFCQTKIQCDELVAFLKARGLSAAALHGDLEQRDRDQVLTLFANRSLSVLVATDVAARGIDIAGLDLVLTAELSRAPKIHIPRVGRRGRAGEKGRAVSLVAPSEAQRASAIEDLQQRALNWKNLDSLKPNGSELLRPPMITLNIGGGRKDKVRPGDILGALTGDAGLKAEQVGKIALFDHQAYVAVERSVAHQALLCLQNGKIKGRSFRVRSL